MDPAGAVIGTPGSDPKYATRPFATGSGMCLTYERMPEREYGRRYTTPFCTVTSSNAIQHVTYGSWSSCTYPESWCHAKLVSGSAALMTYCSQNRYAFSPSVARQI